MELLTSHGARGDAGSERLLIPGDSVDRALASAPEAVRLCDALGEPTHDLTGDNDGSVAFGLGSTGAIITGAAMIMVAVFGGFAAGDLVMFQQMGFGLAVAVILDATVVRSILVPATMKLLGERNWYFPAWLEWLPEIHIEGRLEPVQLPEPALEAA